MSSTPTPTIDEAKSRAMQAQRERNTGPELALRRTLHRRGLRYRLHQRIIPGLRREIDVVFPTERVAVECYGCFWHSCPKHATSPVTNAAWWTEKLKRNVERDRDTARRLRDLGWRLVIVWEHDSADSAANKIERIVGRRRDQIH